MKNSEKQGQTNAATPKASQTKDIKKQRKI